MPGTVKSGLLPDADRSHKCDRQEEVCRWQNLALDNDHFITEAFLLLFILLNVLPVRVAEDLCIPSK